MSYWSLRGLAKDLKCEQLANVCKRYGLDIVGLQETKCTESLEMNLPHNYKLITFDQKNDRHGDVGFVASSLRI